MHTIVENFLPVGIHTVVFGSQFSRFMPGKKKMAFVSLPSSTLKRRCNNMLSIAMQESTEYNVVCVTFVAALKNWLRSTYNHYSFADDANMTNKGIGDILFDGINKHVSLMAVCPQSHPYNSRFFLNRRIGVVVH